MTSTVVASFFVGILSSLAAAWIIFLRDKVRLRVRFRTIVSLVIKVAKNIKLDNFSPDYIVTADRNSGVAGSILAGYLGLRAVVSVACEHHRLADGSLDIRLDDVSSGTLGLLRESRVLILVCCNDSGLTLDCVASYLRHLGQNDPSNIRTAALYTSASPAVMPNYKGLTVGRDIRKPMQQIITEFPWIAQGWQHVLGAERLYRR